MSQLIPIVVCAIAILTNQVIAADRALVIATIREIERDIARTRPDQNNNSPQEPDRNVGSHQDNRR